VPAKNRKKKLANQREKILQLVEAMGTKLGNLAYYLKKLIKENDDARIILFSQVSVYMLVWHASNRLSIVGYSSVAYLTSCLKYWLRVTLNAPSWKGMLVLHSSIHIITCHFCSNVIRRTKAIQNFKAKDSTIRVMMLGLNNAASGTNLMEATHIVLIGRFDFFVEQALIIPHRSHAWH
jgi:hypothetical protein